MTRIENICRVVGQDDPEEFTVFVGGAVANIAGDTYTLDVHTTATPSDNTTRVMNMTGSITDAPSGKVAFTPSGAEAAQVAGTYYYMIKRVDSGGVDTYPTKGKWIHEPSRVV